jgi:putative ABC transport system permease protein
MRVPLRHGRWLERGDMSEGVGHVVVNETAASRLWPGETALGKRFWRKEPDAEVACEVVGVVGDTLDWSKHVAPDPIFYRALRKERGVDIAAKFLVVRTTVDAAILHKPINQALKAAGTDLMMPEIYNLQAVLRTAMAGHRTVMLCLSILGGVGLLLAAVGLYGVLAYSVARRTREIGVRMALGAQIADVTRLILRQGLVLVTAGGVIGITVALATGRVLRAYLFGVSSTDPVTFVAVASLLVIVALFACWLPARRAAKVDPIEALRYE